MVFIKKLYGFKVRIRSKLYDRVVGNPLFFLLCELEGSGGAFIIYFTKAFTTNGKY